MPYHIHRDYKDDPEGSILLSNTYVLSIVYPELFKDMKAWPIFVRKFFFLQSSDETITRMPQIAPSNALHYLMNYIAFWTIIITIIKLKKYISLEV